VCCAPGGLFAACAANSDSHPELAPLLPGGGKRSTFDGEDAGAIVAWVFGAPGDAVQVKRWDGYQNTLSSIPHAAAFLWVSA
jgi:hypothetical protein